MHSVSRRQALSPRRLVRLSTAAAALLACQASAWADGPQFRFSGFGTLGVAHSTNKQADYTANFDQPSGPGYSRSWDAGLDSKLAGQMDVTFSSKFSATAQVETRRRYDASFKPDLMLAFGKWQATPEVSVRLGRLPYPAFLISDYREVGYSQTTVRPPVDFYQGVFPRRFTGADVTWRTSVDSVALKAIGFYGKELAKLPNGIEIDFTRIYGLNLSADVGDMNYRISYMDFKFNPSSAQLGAVFQGVAFGFPAGALGTGSPAIPGDPALANAYYRPGMHTFYGSLSANYDPGDWFVNSEVAMAQAVSFFPQRQFYYVTSGVRLDKFTPYAAVSGMLAENFAVTGHPVVDQILAGSQASSQRTVGIGLRWDAVKNVALKTQFDSVKLDTGSTGQFANVQPGFTPGSRIGIFSLAVDFVF